MEKKQKKKIIAAVVFGAVSLVMVLLVVAIRDKLEGRKLREVGTPLPAFSFMRMDSGTFENKDLRKDTPVALFFLHPECEHCQQEAAELSRNIALFDGTEVMLVSGALPGLLMAFAYDNGLTGRDNVHVLQDSAYKFEEWFGTTPYPTVIAYDRKHILRGHHAGGAKMDLVRKEMGD